MICARGHTHRSPAEAEACDKDLSESYAALRRDTEGDHRQIHGLQEKLDAALLQVDERRSRLYRVGQLAEKIPCACRHSGHDNFVQCPRCRIMEIIAGEPDDYTQKRKGE